MTRSPDVLVLGAGLVGLAVARELVARGATVTVLESGRVGAGASSAGAGLLAPISDWESTEPFVALCREARDGWRAFRDAIVGESGLDVEYDASGAIFVAFDEADEAWIEDERRIAARAGEGWSSLAVAEARRLVPDLSPAARAVALLPGEHRVDNVAALAALAGSCKKRGVRIEEGAAARKIAASPRAVRVETDDGRRFDAAAGVLAAGAWSGALEGVPPLPVRPVRGQMVRLGDVPWPFAGSLRWRHDYVVRRGIADLLVGATVEEAGFAATPTADGIAALLASAARLFPRLAAAPLVSVWAGLRPGSPDGRPLLGRLGDGALWAATGHYRNGILLAPWTGAVIARAILDGDPVPAGDLFSPARFDAPSG